jgi:hypothetical protein
MKKKQRKVKKTEQSKMAICYICQKPFIFKDAGQTMCFRCSLGYADSMSELYY